uniref:Uncharacterized protein n=1 Tax=Oryza punctata TaxID=4537 RepID=A0A0E0KH98_ORYPU
MAAAAAALPDDVLADVRPPPPPARPSAVRGHPPTLARRDLHRPSHRHRLRLPSSISGSLHFLPATATATAGDKPVPPGHHEIQDHCNGLLLLGGGGGDPNNHSSIVVNPATRWCSSPLPPRPPPRMGASTFPADFLVYDPAVSSRYEVFSVPCFRRKCSACHCCLPPGSATSSSSSGGEHVLLNEFSEWPPLLQTLDVYSSSTRRWEERTFHR